jgi:hypothetical protein
MAAADPSAGQEGFATVPPATAPASAAAPDPAPPSAEVKTIESLLQKEQGPGQTTDEEDEAAKPPPAAAPPPPSPPAVRQGTAYADIDSKAYGDAILAAARAAQAMQGPLDGGWRVAGADGRPIYRLRFADGGRGMTLAEGAWRDLALTGPAATGLVNSIGYDGEKLMMRFNEAGEDDPVVLSVRPAGARDWQGELWRHGTSVKVTFSRE